MATILQFAVSVSSSRCQDKEKRVGNTLSTFLNYYTSECKFGLSMIKERREDESLHH